MQKGNLLYPQKGHMTPEAQALSRERLNDCKTAFEKLVERAENAIKNNTAGKFIDECEAIVGGTNTNFASQCKTIEELILAKQKTLCDRALRELEAFTKKTATSIKKIPMIAGLLFATIAYFTFKPNTTA